MCLDLSLQVGSLVTWIVNWLLQKTIPPLVFSSKALKSFLSHNSSEERVVNALYSTSAELLKTVAYLFDLQLIKE